MGHAQERSTWPSRGTPNPEQPRRTSWPEPTRGTHGPWHARNRNDRTWNPLGTTLDAQRDRNAPRRPQLRA
eukprot:9138670-Lingulodinium_polyedra.AAC.1